MKLKRKVGERGQVVIPRDIREEEGLKPHSDVYFSVEDDRIVIEKGDRKLTEVLSRISEKTEVPTKTSDEYHDEEIEKRLERSGVK